MRTTGYKIVQSRRIMLGLTREEAARLSGVSLSSWESWEEGRRRPSASHVTKIGEVLKLSGTELVKLRMAVTGVEKPATLKRRNKIW